MKNMFLDEKKLIACSNLHSFIKISSLNERQGDTPVRLLCSYRLSLTRKVLRTEQSFLRMHSVWGEKVKKKKAQKNIEENKPKKVKNPSAEFWFIGSAENLDINFEFVLFLIKPNRVVWPRYPGISPGVAKIQCSTKKRVKSRNKGYSVKSVGHC